MAVGKTVLVDCRNPVLRVSIGLGEIAEATVITRNEIMVNGKAPGETSLIVWDTLGVRQVFNLTVRPSSAQADAALELIRRELHTEMPGRVLNVTGENGVFFLRGTVPDLVSSTRAVQIASSVGKVINLLNVQVPEAEQQILLKVRFASVDRSKATQLGLNFVNLGLANTIGGITTGQFAPPTVTNSTTTGPLATFSNELNILAFSPGKLPIALDVQALETEGVVQVLAQPNLIATNGKSASFLAGGEYPFPVVQGTAAGGAGAVTIMFKEYGVRLNFIPTITPRGSIRLQVAPEVSSLDFTNAIQISGFNVPAITTRKVTTEVELKDGESFAIGGLLDDREYKTFEKIPFLGDIPVIGKFFQSILKNKTNTELMVIVTPEIIAPTPAGTSPTLPKYPEKFLEADPGFSMSNPQQKTLATTPKVPPSVIPVEKLIESMRPESPLIIQDASGGFGSSSSTQNASTPPPVAPQ